MLRKNVTYFSVYKEMFDDYCYYLVLVTVMFVITYKNYVRDDIGLFKIHYYDLKCQKTSYTRHYCQCLKEIDA